MLGALWTIVTFPFRLIGMAVGLVGRLAGGLIGFLLMVLGVALCSGSLLILGVPLFVVGLLVLVRSFG